MIRCRIETGSGVIMDIIYLEMFAGRFGDERRAKRGVCWPDGWSRPRARWCAGSAAIAPGRWGSGGFSPEAMAKFRDMKTRQKICRRPSRSTARVENRCAMRRGQVLNVEFLRCSHDLRRVRSEAKRSPIAAATRPMM